MSVKKATEPKERRTEPKSTGRLPEGIGWDEWEKATGCEPPCDWYEVVIHLIDIAGGIPPDSMVKKWVEAKNKGKTKQQLQEIQDAHLQDMPFLISEEEKKSTTFFHRDEEGLYIETRLLKAMLREAANCIKFAVPSREGAADDYGIWDLRARVCELLAVHGDQDKDNPFLKDGTTPRYTKKIRLGVMAPHHIQEHPVLLKDDHEEKFSAIGRFEVVEDAKIKFMVSRVATNGVPETAFFEMLKYSALHGGVGAKRSMGYGSFTVESVRKVKSYNYSIPLSALHDWAEKKVAEGKEREKLKRAAVKGKKADESYDASDVALAA